MQDAEGGQALFVDGGVYTRNRAFRLFMSSKAGKDAILLPTGKHSLHAYLSLMSMPADMLTGRGLKMASNIGTCSYNLT